jgi:hypothetical protein
MNAVGAVSEALIRSSHARPLTVLLHQSDQIIALGNIAKSMAALFTNDVFEVNGIAAMVAGKQLHGITLLRAPANLF